MAKKAKKKKLDACAKKVKSRYKVWPSAYASGAVAKCRKVGAKNGGEIRKNETHDTSSKETCGPVREQKEDHSRRRDSCCQEKEKTSWQKMIFVHGSHRTAARDG